VECTNTIRPHSPGRDIGGNDLCPGSICHQDTGRERLFYGTTGSDTEQRIKDYISPLKQGSHCLKIIAAPEGMKGNTTVLQCRKLMLTGSAPFPVIQVADICYNIPLEVAGGNHTVTSIIAFPAQDKNTFRAGSACHVSECFSRTLHKLKFSNSQRYCISINSTHPGRADHPLLKKPSTLFWLHSRAQFMCMNSINNRQWVFVMM
jgi:hypothetical protein